jgi:hypothetical protein
MFVVASFCIEKQGFPTGSRGYDGTVMNPKELAVIRLPRDLAEKLCKDAERIDA